MRRNIIKKEITSVLFSILLLGFICINYCYTIPKLRITEINCVTDYAGVEEAMTGIESDMRKKILGHDIFIEGYGLWNLILDKKEFLNFTQIIDDEGFLHDTDFSTDKDLDVSNMVSSVVNLQNQVAQNHTKVMVVIPPDKDNTKFISYESGLPNLNKNAVADSFVTKLEEYGVHTIDFRKTLPITYINYRDMYYGTDSNWTTKNVFCCYQTFIQDMKDWYNEDLDPEGLYTDINNYNKLIYQDCFLGNQGKNTGAVYAGKLDDYTILYPKYNTSYVYTWLDSDKTNVQRGRFEDSLLFMNHIFDSDIYSSDKYKTYLNGEFVLRQITNNLDTSNKKILFLGDSSIAPFASFVSQNVSRTDIISVEKLQDTLEKYVNISDYNYIVISLYPKNIDENHLVLDENK